MGLDSSNKEISAVKSSVTTACSVVAWFEFSTALPHLMREAIIQYSENKPKNSNFTKHGRKAK